jgi:hypothetical protein
LATIQGSTTKLGLTILNKLEFAPREKITVVTIDPNTFDGITIFDACYPVFTPLEIDATRKAQGLWEGLTNSDPLDQQRENLQAFDAQLRNTLDKIVVASKKYRDGERRNVLGAIAVDKNRYLDQNSYYRIIIYSDGTIKEPGTDRASNEVTPPAIKILERYPVSFSGAEVAVCGDAEGWVAFNVGREQLYVPFEGQYTCTADECRLTADCTMSVPPEAAAPYFRKGDRIVLSGEAGRALEGSLRADSREVFEEGNQSVSYGLKFSSQ